MKIATKILPIVDKVMTNLPVHVMIAIMSGVGTNTQQSLIVVVLEIASVNFDFDI